MSHGHLFLKIKTNTYDIYYRIFTKLKNQEKQEKLGNFAKFYGNLIFLILKKFAYITPTQFWNT